MPEIEPQSVAELFSKKQAVSFIEGGVLSEKLLMIRKRERRRQARLPLFLSLRGKGWLFTGLLAVYFLIVSLVVAYERETMLESVALLQSINEREESLVGLNYAVSRTVISVNENYFAPDVEASGKMLVLEIEALLPGLARLQGAYPELAEFREGLEKTVLELVAEPTRASIADLRAIMHRLVLALDRVTADVSANKIKFAEQYHNSFQRLSQEWVAFGVVALILVAAVFKVFFRGLAADLDRVRRHAVRVSKGEPSVHLKHQRRDEEVQCKEAVERSVRDDEISANPFGKGGADERYGVEQRDDHLRPPVGHIAPGQQITEECGGHQHNKYKQHK